ncbi:hypothetical protein CASFOL_009865 [Castilleja foliolosa]|uniref:Bifunctional inhibitor/plant lipid transfer protein/seed storage helical domain-containing protein n=1 Tax=Castilleja foliolosa TaxID=1961234 RepID=A0ABD3DQV6_9LAMI
MNSKIVALAFIFAVLAVFLGDVDLATIAGPKTCHFDELKPCQSWVEKNDTKVDPSKGCCNVLKSQYASECICYYITQNSNETIKGWVKMAGDNLCKACQVDNKCKKN